MRSAYFVIAFVATLGNGFAAAVPPTFDTNRVASIELTISETNWNQLRYQHREAEFFPEDDKAAPGDSYTWFPAELTLNGTNFGRAEIRKKGYIGSNDIRRPGLKLRLRRNSKNKPENKADDAGAATEISLDLTLNNNRQDPALIRQYLAYEVFRRAGIPAPRCSFVNLKLNGKDLGIYTCVEPINAAFLQRNFGNSTGNLYEGGRSDFRSNWVQNFVIKNDRKQNDRADLERATRDIEAAGASVGAALERHFDADEFFRFWAVESLLNTSDGYAANMNNFYLYGNPSTSKFIFIPWGPDATFNFGRAMNSVRGDPKSVIGTGILANRLYNSADGAEKYRTTLRAILKTAWNEEVLLREVKRLEALLAPFLRAPAAQFHGNVEEVRRFIQTRRDELTPELNGPAPILKSRPLELAKRRNVGAFAGKFSVKLANGRPVPPSKTSTNSITLTGTLWDEPLTFREVILETQMQSNVESDDPSSDNRIFIGFIATTAGAQQYVLYLGIDPDSYVTGRPIPINNTHIMGFCGTRERNLGMLRGSLLLTAAPKTGNGQLSGEFTADLFTKHPKP
jgi:hypothetical protein